MLHSSKSSCFTLLPVKGWLFDFPDFLGFSVIKHHLQIWRFFGSSVLNHAEGVAEGDFKLAVLIKNLITVHCPGLGHLV